MVDGQTTDHRFVNQKTGSIRVIIYLQIRETLFNITEVEYNAVLDILWFKQANSLIR